MHQRWSMTPSLRIYNRRRRILVTGAATGIGAAAGQVLSEAGSPISALYAATKGAVAAWTLSIAKAWTAKNVTAVALAPAVQIPGADRLREFVGPEAAELIDQQIKATIPLGRALGDPARDLGPVLVFLVGGGSRFITGQLLAVDRGLVMLGS
jgi:3-oxoacyl-[acyl-carrier protein] reductase